MNPEPVITHTPPPGWEEFVLNVPWPHFEQSGHWADAESHDGWEPHFVTINGPAGIDAGAMILIKRVRRIGRVGYVFRGPTIRGAATATTGLNQAACELLKSAARKTALRLLVVVPPYEGSTWSQLALDSGFILHPAALPPTGLPHATMSVDLNRTQEALELSFRRSTRQEIKLGRKAGIIVETGAAAELDEFWRLHEMLCQRRGVRSNVPSSDFVRTLWARFSPVNRIWLFRVRDNAEALCSLLCLRAGSVCYAWRVGWSGRAAEKYPTKVLYTEAMRQVAAEGCRRFDFMQIDPDVAEALRSGGKSQHRDAGLTLFKLGFAGDIIRLPPTLVWLPNPFLRQLARTILFPAIGRLNRHSR